MIESYIHAGSVPTRILWNRFSISLLKLCSIDLQRVRKRSRLFMLPQPLPARLIKVVVSPSFDVYIKDVHFS